MCMIAAFFAQVLQRCLGRPCTSCLFLRQEARTIDTTHNQLSEKDIL
jgi:hypothetical protein